MLLSVQGKNPLKQRNEAEHKVGIDRGKKSRFTYDTCRGGLGSVEEPTVRVLSSIIDCPSVQGAYWKFLSSKLQRSLCSHYRR